MTVQKIVLASTSEIKRLACVAAFPNAQIVMAMVRSGVAEQPMGDETLRGARNRLGNARVITPDADLYVSIENGIFIDADAYVDRAVVLLQDRQRRETVFYSEGVAFPAAAVEIAQARGFQFHTVGAVLAEQGVIKHAADPHRCLSGTPRATYIRDALQAAARLHQQDVKAMPQSPRTPRR